MNDPKQILDRLRALETDDIAACDGRAFGYSYFAGDALDQLARDAYAMYLSKNALDPRAFPSVSKLEHDVVAQVGSWMHLPSSGKATFTSGGTESILLAVKAARDQRKPARRGNVVAPVTAHGAFRKAAEYLGLAFRASQVAPSIYRCDASTLEPLIDDDTIMLVAPLRSTRTARSTT